MPRYIAQKEVRYAGKTYVAGDVVPVNINDIRVLKAIGSIREEPRDDRVRDYVPPPAGPTVAEHKQMHAEHMDIDELGVDFVHEEYDPADTVSGGAVPHGPEETDFAGVHVADSEQPSLDEFVVEETTLPEELKEEEEVNTAYPKRRYRHRRMQSEE